MASMLTPPNFSVAANEVLNESTMSHMMPTSASPSTGHGDPMTGLSPEYAPPDRFFNQSAPAQQQQPPPSRNNNYPRSHYDHQHLQSQQPSHKVRSNSSVFSSKLLLFVIVLIIVAILVYAGYKWYQNRQVQLQVNQQPNNAPNRAGFPADYSMRSAAADPNRFLNKPDRDSSDSSDDSSPNTTRFAGSRQYSSSRFDVRSSVEDDPKYQETVESRNQLERKNQKLQSMIQQERETYKQLRHMFETLSEKVHLQTKLQGKSKNQPTPAESNSAMNPRMGSSKPASMTSSSSSGGLKIEVLPDQPKSTMVPPIPSVPPLDDESSEPQ